MFDSVSLYWFTDELVKLAEDIQPGDIVIMSQRREAPGTKRGILGEAFATLAPRVQGALGHSAIVSTRGTIIESRIDEGVTEKTFRNAVRGMSYTVKRPPFSEETRKKAAKFAEKQVGKAYSTSDLLLESVGAVLPESLTLGIQKKLELPRDREGYTCASLITAAYGSAKLSNISGRLTTPGDFVYSDKLPTVKTKVKDHSPLFSPTIGRIVRGLRDN